MKINKMMSNAKIDVWECECGTDTPVKKGSPKPKCEYCRRVNEKKAKITTEVRTEGSESIDEINFTIKGKCYICKTRKGTIVINKFGDRICRECNEVFDTWFLVQRIKGKLNPTDEIRDAFIISYGNLEVLKRIPEMMADAKWREKLRRLVIEFIGERDVRRIR